MSSTWDYIVVGAGSSGCVVASRLSEDPDVRVLLLEAGPAAENFWINVPAGMAYLFRSEDYNWRFTTEPVPTLRNRPIYWPRGKTLGGSSAINGMVYARGNRGDFDHWAKLGNAGWSWDDVLPYFKRSEDNQQGADEFHGVGGPLAVSEPTVKPRMVYDFVEAAQRCGIHRVERFNGSEPEGVGFLQATIRNGVRQSSYSSFIEPIRHRRNLTILTSAHVRRIVFRGHEATGVEVLNEGRIDVLSAQREVVLSAGALGSPHLLMLSGIGDGEMLRQYGIPSLVHLPGVGRNLQDHFSVRVQARTTPSGSYNKELNGWRKYLHGARYLVSHRGYLALPSSLAAAFVKSSPDREYADLEISFRPMTFSYDASGNVSVDNWPAMSASIYRVRPASRGEVVLRSADFLTPPAFHPNYLGDAEDVQATLTGFRILRNILSQAPIASRIVGETVPGPGITTDEQVLDFMEREGQCAFHPAGTCKMGNDAMSVVDSELRVKECSRLRIIDASIMPTVTSGNTNAPAIMIGEKGADLIRQSVNARTAA
jgi:choline dehydrogenase